MIQLGILDFLLDLALDWDNVPSYEYLVPDPETHAYESDAHETLYVSPVIHHVKPSAEVDPYAEVSEMLWDIRLPIFRGGVSSKEAHERMRSIPSTLVVAEESARFLVDGIKYHFTPEDRGRY